mgnify:CR=1 FL=1
MRGWIGVDLDGTLANYEGWRGAEYIGDPIAAMVERVKAWRADGKEVRIFTARVHPLAYIAPNGDYIAISDAGHAEIGYACRVVNRIHEWMTIHLGEVLPVTCCKDYGMVEMWDDRAVRVKANTGEPCCGQAGSAP